MEQIVAEFLSKEEAHRWSNSLTQNGIQCSVKETGYSNLSRIKTGSTYFSCYDVFISEKDFQRAAPVIRKINNGKKGLQDLTCPKCKAHSPYIKIKKKNFWESIVALGVTILQCSKCHQKWYS